MADKKNDNEPGKSSFLNESTGRMIQLLTCPKCEYTANHKRRMNQHIMRKHSKHRPYKCTHSNCKYATITPFELKNHMNIHNLDESYNCPSCDKEFAFKTHLNKHVLLVHTLPDEEVKSRVTSHECPHCPAIFTKAVTLRKHVATHFDVIQADQPELKCSICDFSSRNKMGLSNHMKRKHDPKRDIYECTQCDFTAKAKTTFDTHIAKCKGEKPYSCNKCDFKSSLLRNLYKHSEIHFVQ